MSEAVRSSCGARQVLTPTALRQDQAARYAAALAALGDGRLAEADAVARHLVEASPTAPDAHHLQALCLAQSATPDAAEPAFRQALALAPDSVPVLLNFARWLRVQGRQAEADPRLRRALARAPEDAQAWLQLGLNATALGHLDEAHAALVRASALGAPTAAAWHGLGNALGRERRHADADRAYTAALQVQPTYVPAWILRGTTLRLLGHPDRALDCFQQAARLGADEPDLHDAVSGALLDAGRVTDAIANAQALAAAQPGHVQAQVTCAQLLWEYGAQHAPGVAPLATFARAAAVRRDHRDLQLAYLRLLLQAGLAGDALDWSTALPAALVDDPVVVWLRADAFERLHRDAEADAAYRRALAGLGDVPALCNAYARHCLRVGRWQDAAASSGRVIRIAPYDQEAWSILGTAWRLLDDPRHVWLFDPDRLIGRVQVEPPPGHGSMADFLAELDSALSPLHRASHAPVGQSLRRGSQTPGNLFGRPLPILDVLHAQLNAAVEDWLATLPDDARHPFLARRRRGVRIDGSWSVRLQRGGSHHDHIHSRGWMSSAFYVRLPPSMAGHSDDQAGCIRFGQPHQDLGLALAPLRVIRPQPGQLVLFPSYMWHGTVPFHDDAVRTTVAFDMSPAD